MKIDIKFNKQDNITVDVLLYAYDCIESVCKSKDNSGYDYMVLTWRWYTSCDGIRYCIDYKLTKKGMKILIEKEKVKEND